MKKQNKKKRTLPCPPFLKFSIEVETQFSSVIQTEILLLDTTQKIKPRKLVNNRIALQYQQTFQLNDYF
jgi:hypothetical protein